MDEIERRRIECLLESTEEDDLLGGFSSDDNDNNTPTYEPHDQNTDTEQSISSASSIGNISNESDSEYSYHESDDDLPISMRRKFFIGKDGTKWNRKPNVRVRIANYNKVTEKSGVKLIAKSAKTILECWMLFFSNDMLEHIVKMTNIYIEKVRPNYNRERDASETCVREIKALLGILYTIGAIKCNHRSTEDLWKIDGCGVDILACVMSEHRFRFLLRCIRFDDIRGRDIRKKIDNMTHIRHIFDLFVNNCKNTYTVSEYCTIDEKLQSFRGHCSFRVYMPNKPAKYGLKMFALVDSINYYTLNIELYAGKQPDGPFLVDNAASCVVKRLANPILNTGRNITFDNWFTSFPLADYLLQNKTTMVGTVRKNKREIPPEFLISKGRDLYSSYFGFSKNKSIVSYKAKSNKIVLIASTMHNDKAIDMNTGEKLKPEMITFYNSTKSGVDTMDWMTENYSVARHSARWPLTVFYSLLNIGGLNSMIVYQENTQVKKTRLEFLKSLGRQLMEDQLKYRMTISSLPRPLKTRLQNYVTVEREVLPQKLRSSNRCAFCERAKDKKTTKVCTNCIKPICRDHLIEICPDCFTL